MRRVEFLLWANANRPAEGHLGECLTELGADAIASVREHGAEVNASINQALQFIERDTPLGPECDFIRHAHLFPTLGISCP
jgi:hypothetical protein